MVLQFQASMTFCSYWKREKLKLINKLFFSYLSSNTFQQLISFNDITFFGGGCDAAAADGQFRNEMDPFSGLLIGIVYLENLHLALQL